LRHAGKGEFPMRRFFAFRADAKRTGRASAESDGEAFVPAPAAPPFRIWHNRFFLAFLAALVVVNVAVVTVGLRMSSFYRLLHEQGRTTVADITRHEVKPAIRAAPNDYYFYTYQTSAGATHENSTSVRTFNAGDTVTVTYLPETPEDHVFYRMTPSRNRQPIWGACTFAAGSLSVTLGFGTLVQWALGRRTK
jgi:hypothetical protein